MIATAATPVPFSVTLHQPVDGQIATEPRARQKFRTSRKPKIPPKTLKPDPSGARNPFMRLP
jgi:hypothetical protein